MLEIESARTVETTAEGFLKMTAKNHRYRDKCRKMYAQLRAGGTTQSVKEELDKKDEELMRSIHRYSKQEELLHSKDEELEVVKGVAAGCEDRQEKVLSLQVELEQNATTVANLSAE